MSDSYVSPRSTPDDGALDDARRLEELLTGDTLPETENEMSVSRLLDALRAPGRPDELRHTESTTAAFVAARHEALADGGVVVPLAARRRRPAVVAGAAVAGVLTSVALVGTAAAALTGSLPDPVQRWAHNAVGAPAPVSDQDDVDNASAGAKPGSTSTSSSGQGPSAGPSAAAVAGLCRAFGAVTGPQSGSTANQALTAAAAAKGTTVENYCAGVLATAQPTVPPGSTTKPTVAPGSTKKPTVAPGSTTKPTAAPGSTKKPASNSSDSATKAAAPRS